VRDINSCRKSLYVCIDIARPRLKHYCCWLDAIDACAVLDVMTAVGILAARPSIGHLCYNVAAAASDLSAVCDNMYAYRRRNVIEPINLAIYISTRKIYFILVCSLSRSLPSS